MNIQGIGTLITGASQGLGAALTRQLATLGAKVVLLARHKEPLENIANELRQQGNDVHILQGDIGDKDAIYPIAGAASSLVGPIDLLIHNASTLGPLPMPLLLETECEDFERVLSVNLVGPFRLSKIIAGSMALRKRGLIIHITSDAAQNAYPGWGSYGVSKVALGHLGRIWAEELKENKVRFLNIDPGEMNTKMHQDALPDADPSTLADPKDVALQIVRMIEESKNISSGALVEAQQFEVQL